MKNRCPRRRPALLPSLVVPALLSAALILGAPQPAWADTGLVPAADDGAFARVTAIVGEALQVFGSLAGIYLTGTIVFSLAQANIEAATSGRPSVLADAQERIVPAVICFIVAVCAKTLSEQTPVSPAGSWATTAVTAVGVWKAIAAFVIQIVLYSAGAVMAVGFATGGLAAQVAVLTGQPGALSQGWMRLLLVGATGILTLVSVQMANWIVQAAI